MRHVILTFAVGLACLLVIQLPIYQWLGKKIISRRESPPQSEFGLIPIQLLQGVGDTASFKGAYGLEYVGLGIVVSIVCSR
jgi:hypothetical protein